MLHDNDAKCCYKDTSAYQEAMNLLAEEGSVVSESDLHTYVAKIKMVMFNEQSNHLYYAKACGAETKSLLFSPMTEVLADDLSEIMDYTISCKAFRADMVMISIKDIITQIPKECVEDVVAFQICLNKCSGFTFYDRNSNSHQVPVKFYKHAQ